MTYPTAVKYLKQFFSNSSTDWVSIEDVYTIAGRAFHNADQNRTWLQNKIPYMKRHGLVEQTYGKKNHVRVISGLKLLEQGKVALNRRPSDSQQGIIMLSQKQDKLPASSEQKINEEKNDFYKILQILTKISEENPNLKIEYSLKNEVISVQQRG